MIDIELIDRVNQEAVIKVIGVGGGGGNAVEQMVASQIEGVEFINANTDSQVLDKSQCDVLLQIGSTLTKGLGAGANPDIGRQAALEDKDRIAEVLEGADMIFITAGMGGGTGTGAAPVIAEIAKSMGILTVAVVTKPFPFEGKKRMAMAEQGIEALTQHVDSLIAIPNAKVLEMTGKKTTMMEAFHTANQVLYNAVKGISDLIVKPGLINVDFADVRAVMLEMGNAIMGSASASGENRAADAVRMAIQSPLLDDVNIEGARGVLVNVSGGLDMGIHEFEEVGEVVGALASDDATVVVGAVIDPDMHDEIRVTVVATGIGERKVATTVFDNDRASNIKPFEVARSAPRETGFPFEAREEAPVSRSAAATAPAAAPLDDDSPSVLVRSNREPREQRRNGTNGGYDPNSSEFDVPTFLRRQAD